MQNSCVAASRQVTMELIFISFRRAHELRCKARQNAFSYKFNELVYNNLVYRFLRYIFLDIQMQS